MDRRANLRQPPRRTLLHAGNRLVARTLERAWEDRLRQQQQIEQEYRRFQESQPQQLTERERDEIYRLAGDLPALWKAQDTTDEDRKEILRQVIDHVVVNVERDTEWVEVQVQWAGGKQSYSRIRRPVAGASQLSRWPELINRLQQLKAENLTSTAIADRLHQEGFKPPKGARITTQIVRTWLSRYDLVKSREELPVELAENEWTIPAIIRRYRVASSTIHGWICRNHIKSRQIGGRGGRWIVEATPAELEQLVNNRKNHPKATDQECSDGPQLEHETCSKRGIASQSAH